MLSEKKVKENYEVVVIGNDHTNTLGVLRMFGENGILSNLYLLSDDNNKISVSKCKYLKCIKIFDNERNLFDALINDFKKHKLKPILIPTSDGMAAMIDKKYDILSKKFITQNIDNKKNQIIKYMDKFEQYKFIKKYNIKIARSKIINFPFNKNEIIDEFSFPLIIKPLLSIDGKKSDITIVKNEEQLKKGIDDLSKTYQRLLIQELISYDYECDMSGYSYDNEVCIVGYIQKKRIWPKGRGSMTFGVVKKYENFKNQLDVIKKILKDLKYSGMFDVEFFVKNDTIILNEINFRNSGLTYLYGESYLVYNYYLSCINDFFIEAPKIKEEYYVMDEQSEMHQIIEKNISIFEHLKDKKKSKCFLIKNKNDKKPAKYFLINKVKRKIGKVFK